MAEEPETKLKVEGSNDGVLSIKVKDQHGGEVVFKVKKTTKFSKVLDAFCQKKAWDANQVRFVYDGQRIQPGHTPEEMGMENNDTIDAFLEQVGGAAV